MARAFHRSSPLRDRPFLALDCHDDQALLRRALRCWLLPTSVGAGLNPLRPVEGGVLYLDRLERLSAPSQRQLLLLIRCLQRGEQAVAGAMPARLAAGSDADLDGRSRGRVIADLLDCLDKIRIRVGRQGGSGGQGDEVGPGVSGRSAR